MAIIDTHDRHYTLLLLSPRMPITAGSFGTIMLTGRGGQFRTFLEKPLC